MAEIATATATGSDRNFLRSAVPPAGLVALDGKRLVRPLVKVPAISLRFYPLLPLPPEADQAHVVALRMASHELLHVAEDLSPLGRYARRPAGQLRHQPLEAVSSSRGFIASVMPSV